MVRKMIVKEYLDVAEKCARARRVEALQCLAKAIEIDPTVGLEETQPILSALLDDRGNENLSTLRNYEPVDSDWLELRLAKLERIHNSDNQIANSSRVPDLLDAGRPAEPLGALYRRLERLLERLDGLQPDKSESAKRLIRNLLGSLNHRGSGEHSAANSDDDELLSVEHALHNTGNDFYNHATDDDNLDYFDAAICCYEAALVLRPDLLESWFNKSLALTRCKRYDQAATVMAHVIELNPHIAEAYYTRGLINEYRGRLKEAEGDYEQTLVVDPRYPKAETQLQVLRGKLNNDRSDSKRATEINDGEIEDFSRYLVRPDCSLSDVGGHEAVKRELRKIIAFLHGNPAFAEWGAEPPRGVLMYGPPGSGKTHLSRCLAGEAHVPFYAPPTSIFASKWHGVTEQNFGRLLDQASEHPAAIIFLDEFDALGARRADTEESGSWYNRVIGALLEGFDNLAHRSSSVVIIAATNRRKDIDRAFLRPGRFNLLLPVKRPEPRSLAEIWLVLLREAEARAARVHLLSPELDSAVSTDGQAWLDRAFRQDAEDCSGLVHLSKACAQKRLVGADVQELIRRAVDERAMTEIETGWRLDPIGPNDLRQALDNYQR